MEFLMVRQGEGGGEGGCGHKPSPTIKTSIQFSDFAEP